MKLRNVLVSIIIIVLIFLCSFYSCMDLVTGIECEKKVNSIEPINQSSSEVENKKINQNYITIILDAGHGNMDSGSISQSGVYEKDLTLDITLKIGEALSKNGMQVIYTRTNDEYEWKGEVSDLQKRIDIAVANEGDYFISINLNSSEYNDGAKGFEIYTDNRNEELSDLAKSIESYLTNLNFTENRGIKLTDESGYLYVIDRNPIPSVLVELGFISDDSDFTYLNSEKGKSEIAEAISKSILESVMSN